MQKLPAATQEVLKLAACLGNYFDLETLAVVCDRQRYEVASNLWSALQEGLMVPDSDPYKFFPESDRELEASQDITISYHFLHDRVQQAAYALIPENQQATTHYHIGALLRENLPIEKQQ